MTQKGKMGTWLVFDINETVLSLEPVEKKVNEVLKNPRGFDFWFNKVLTTSHVYAHTGSGADFTAMQKYALFSTAKALGTSGVTDADWDAIRQTMGTMPCHAEVPEALKELKRKNVKQEKVNKALENAKKEINFLATWVGSSKEELEEVLEDFRVAISTSLGIRSQEKFSEELALSLAACNANHRDLSLNF